ncbi:uncharacterized protein prr14 [Salminus brasiliensis]|uniref:uncharacterized protein prr14 n=1 Tax=Salminus brasiliensis TaxID=930266 RepID=UPI003B8358DD
MLTSSQERIPQSVTPMEEDVLCAVRHAEPRPHAVRRSSVLHSCGDGGSSSRRRSGRLLRGKDEPENSARAPAPNTSLIQKERESKKSHEDTGEIQWPGEKTVRGCKRKLELPSITTQSHVSKDSTAVEEHSLTSVDFETKCTGSPPPAKRWVIGPLLQSFKSKMASFTEIVMSPVRLFKPSDSSLSNALPSHREQVAGFNKDSSSRTEEGRADVDKDGTEEVFSKDETKYTPQRESTVVQRLRFNTNSGNLSDSDDNKVMQSEGQQRKDGLPDLSQSLPQDGSSNTTDLSSSGSREPLGPLSVQEQIMSHDEPASEKELYEATSTSEQSDRSNLAQETSGFTKPRLLVALTDMAHTLGIRSPSHEATHQNTSSFLPLALTEDGDRKGLLDSKEPSLRMPIKISPRKTSKPPSEELPLVKSVKKASVTLSERLDDVSKSGNVSKSKSNNKAQIQPLSKAKEVLTPGCGTGRKRKDTPKTSVVGELRKEELAKKAMSSSKRTRMDSRLGVEESPTLTLARMDGNVASVGKRKKVQASENLSIGICKAQVVLRMMGPIPERPDPCASVERQERASRSKSRRDAQCRPPTALGIQHSTSDHSSSADATKSALMDNSLQGNGADLVSTSGQCADFASVEAGKSIKSTSPQRMVGDEPLGKSTRSQKTTRRCKVMLCKVRTTEDWDRRVEAHSVAGKAGEPSATVGHRDPAELSDAINQECSKITRRNNVRQAAQKPEAASAAPGASSIGPHTKKSTGDVNRSETRAAKRTTDAIEEPRVSMSFTLQVDTEADDRNGALMLPPVNSASTALWPTARPVHSRVTRRLGKMGTPAEERNGTSSVSKSTSMHLQALNDQGDDDDDDDDDGHLARKEKNLKVDRQRRRCISLAKKKAAQEDQDEQTQNLEESQAAAAVAAAVAAAASGSGSSRLLRSFSCPDIPFLLHSDRTPLLPLHDPVPPSPPKKSCPAPPHTPHPHSPSKRARRHTVCSVEIEREIAPLCLRKEVCPYSHSNSLTTLASTFLSSPLAFLSKKSSQGRSDDGHGLDCTSPRSLTKSSSPSFLKSPTSPTLTAIPAFSASVPHTPEQSSASVSSPCSVFEPVPVEADGVVQRECEEDERPSFSLELSSRAISEEKALSDSEIKTDDKQVERRKVSSIRIRKTLPKPQYNLTPMGLPKAIRIKKKDFSVEEIYTNKNFSKPPEGRLETIFEVPLSRRDGSQSLIGQKRMKRFVEFPELGVARKPRKPLVGSAGVGAAQRKAAGNSGAGRTRRGVWASSREEDALTLQDLDSLLCSKLSELDSWMAREQVAY